MVDLGVSEEDAKRYVSQSNKYIEVRCPNCGKNVKKRICKIYNYKSIGCSCGDGISYPEKFMNDVLNQLNVEFQSQLTKTTFEWCGDKRYDFYIPEYNMIIETHGRQHYTDNTNFKMSLKEVQENDRLKENLAKENDIKNYIVIDCRESDLEYIKNSILNSKLNDIFDLSQINWNKCEEFALKNIVKEVCDYWNDREDWETTGTIINNNKWGIKDRSCLIDYLKKGNRLNWCVYDPKYEKSKSSSKNGKLFAKQVEVFKDNVSLGIFESASEFSRRSKDEFGVYISVSSISNVCSGRYQSCKGFSFRYII
nr:MAG TPA: restriction enzyme [Caudoviricetes sp.]